MAIVSNGSRQTNELTNSQYNKNFIGAETLLLRRDIYHAIHNRYREKEGLAEILLNLGKKKKTANTTFNWFEHDYLINTVTGVTGDGTPNPAPTASTMIVEVGAGSHQDSLGTVGEYSPFLVGDLVKANIGAGTENYAFQIKAVDKTSAGNHLYTLERVDDAVAVTSVFNVAGGETVNLFWYSNAFADGSGQPGASNRKPLNFNNVTQIHKTSEKVFGSESANEVEVNIGGKPYYYRQGVDDMTTKHMMAQNFQLAFGEKSSGLLDASGEEVLTGESLEQAIDTRGNTSTYGTLGWSDLEEMVKTLDTEMAPNTYMGLLGIDLLLDFESIMASRGMGIRGVNADFTADGTPREGGTGIDYSMYGKGGKSYDYSFDSYRIGNRTFHAKKEGGLNYKPITGYANSLYPGMGFFMPMTTVKDAKTHEMLDSVCLRYKANDLENRFMAEWTRNRKQTNEDKWEWNMQSELGLQLALVNQYVKMVAS
jgi:hypothetical protein